MALQEINQSVPFVGLGTTQATCLTDGEYTVRCTSTLPPGSELAITVFKNGSQVYSIGGGTGALGPSLAGEKTVLCVAGDILSVLLASSAAPDAVRNAVKSTVTIFQAQKFS